MTAAGGWSGKPRDTSYSSKGSGSPGVLRSDRTTDLCVAPDGDSGAKGIRW